MKPGSPLPWTLGTCCIWSGERFVAGTQCGAGITESRENAEYITHAANNYPALVDALKTCLLRMDHAALALGLPRSKAAEAAQARLVLAHCLEML